MKYAQRAREIIDIEIAGLEKVGQGFGPEFEHAVEMMLTSLSNGKKIIVTGVGKNLFIGQKIAATLTSTGSTAVFLHAGDAMHGDLGVLSDGDTLLVLSYSGESEELMTLIPAVRRMNVQIIALTGSRDNSLAKLCDETILATVEREACPFNLAPTTSTTAALAAGDAVAMVLLEARGFRREDYAKFHPAGAIGRSLLIRVSDIMRTGDRMAALRCGQTVKDAIMAMTEARSGAVAVVDEYDKVVGVFTDGDLRRHITDTPDLPNQLIDEVMSKDPLTVAEDHLAVDVLSLFEKHNIDDLIVVHDGGKLAGMIDIQDLPKFKIM